MIEPVHDTQARRTTVDGCAAEWIAASCSSLDKTLGALLDVPFRVIHDGASCPTGVVGAFTTITGVARDHMLGLTGRPADIAVFAARLAGTPATPKEAQDVICELVNILAGHAKAEMERIGKTHELELAVPMYLEGIPSGPIVIGQQFGTIVFGDIELHLVALDLQSSPETCERRRLQQQLTDEANRLRDARREISKLVNFDTCTGLPNRRYLEAQIQRMLVGRAEQDTLFALVAIDLDHFHLLNNSLGFEVGDEVLAQVAERLTDGLGGTSTAWLGDTSRGGPDPVVAHFGGDEFFVALPALKGVDDAVALVARLSASIAQPLRVREHDLKLTASFGIATFRYRELNGAELDALTVNAKSALAAAKAAGRNCYRFYTQTLTDTELRRVWLENELSKAIRRRQVLTYYQPRVDIERRQIIGAEALVRWIHPDRGFISPGEFIPIAEETGQVVELGEVVLWQACHDVARWDQAGLPSLSVSVNVAARQLTEGLAETVAGALDASGLDARRLELEVTERTIMHNTTEHLAALAALKKIGVRIALDDFGTGYSSLSYLTRFPIDLLKVDRSFVSRLLEDEKSAAITSAIVALGRGLGLRVVAEGVESLDELSFLESRRCDEAQGFLFSPALQNDAFIAWASGFRWPISAGNR